MNHSLQHGHRISAAVACALLSAAVALAPAGCGRSGGPARYDLSGKVTFQGEPVPSGSINFTPDRDKDNTGPGAFAPIKNGHYETPPGAGVAGGPHKVMIFGYGEPPAGPNGPDEAPELFSPMEIEIDLPREDTTWDFDLPLD